MPIKRPTPRIDRRGREQALVREKILAAARELFIRDGFEAVSMRKIAQAIEYTPPAIYTHFADKATLMRELCFQDYGALAARFLRLSKVADPVERVLKAGLTYIRFAIDHPNHYRLMFMTPPPQGFEFQAEDLARMSDPEQDGYAFLTHSIQDAITLGRFRPEYHDAELIGQMLWAGVHGLASLQITHKHDPCVKWRSVEKLSRGICESMLRGMLADPTELDRAEGKARR